VAQELARYGEAPITTHTGDILSPLGPQDPRETAGYRLAARIGEGGMGTVYLSHTRGGQPVALKVIRREYGQDPDFRRRFEQEVQAARRVQGYHIVPVVDHDTSGELPWLASVFIPGIPLHEALVAFGPLPPAAVFQLVGCTARALSAIHAAGVVHRDLKPSNILLGAKGPYVIDFGIARAADATQLTQSGGLIGTPQYMSPEHALGEPVGPATDVFSLGLIAAVAATGRHPYGDGGAITIAAQIANTAQRPPQLSSYDERLRPLLERCLTADPGQRVGTEELAALCQELAGRGLSDFNGWLPAPLTAEIARREQAAQAPPQPTAPQMPSAPPSTPPSVPPATPPPSTGFGPPTPSPSTGFGPSAPGPATGYGPPPSDPHTYHLAPAPAAPPRRRVRTALIAAALVVAVGAGAGTAVWLLGKDKGGSANESKGQGRQTTSAPAPTKSQQGDGGSPSPEGSESVPAAATYEQVFAGKAFTIRRPESPNTNYVDFDEPKVDTESTMASDLRDMTVENAQWDFETTMGKSAGASAEQCREGAKTDVLPNTVASTEFGEKRLISEGTRLCTVTKDGNLAMYEITGLTPGDYSWEVPSVTGTMTLWKISD
jgi:serine/threonine protein kinase